MRILLWLGRFLILWFPTEAFTQNRTITGLVQDYNTREILPFATVKDNNQNTFQSDANGKFICKSFSVNEYFTLITSYTGYNSDTLSLSSTQDFFTILLRPREVRLHDVVVTTGVSRAQSVKVNPVPIMVISGKTIDQTIGNNLIDALGQSAPGFNSVKTGPGVSKPFIHGLGYNRVLTLYDGVRQEGQQWGDEHGIVVDDYNIERAEIIKGPASLMYGSDAIAGVLSLFPIQPVNTDGKLKGRFTTEYQSNNGLFGNGIRILYGKNHWSYALRGSFRIAKNYHSPVDGWIYNTNFKTINLSFTALYRSSSGYSSFNLNLYENQQGIPDGSRDSLTRNFTRQIYETGGNPPDEIQNRPLVPAGLLNTYQLSPLHQKIQDYKFYSNSHYSIGKGWFDGQIALTQNFRTEYNHPTAPDQAGLSLRLLTLNYGFRYSMQIFDGIEMTIGMNGMYQQNRNLQATDFPIPDFNLLDVGSYIYVHRKMNRWAFSGGIRYDSRFLNSNNFYTGPDSISGFTKHLFFADTTGGYLQFPAINKTFGGISFSIGATFQVNENITIKANLARGFRAPNISEYASNGLDPGAHIVYIGNRGANPEFSMQEDIGMIISYRDISASVSLFNNHIQDYIYQAQATDQQGNPLVIVPGNRTFQYVQSAAQIFGFEASANIHPADINGFSFENSLTMIGGYNRNPIYKNKGTDGEYLPFMPPTRLVSSVRQEFHLRSPIIHTLSVKAQADYNAAQNNFLGLNQTESATKGYTLFNVAFMMNVSYTKSYALQFQIQANNLFNTIYQSNQSRLKYFEYYSASPSGYLGIYEMGRNLCFKLIMPF